MGYLKTARPWHASSLLEDGVQKSPLAVCPRPSVLPTLPVLGMNYSVEFQDAAIKTWKDAVTHARWPLQLRCLLGGVHGGGLGGVFSFSAPSLTLLF